MLWVSFNIFGNPTKDDIRVAYISTERDGYNVTVCEANDYAKLNLNQFTFRTKDITRYEYKWSQQINS